MPINWLQNVEPKTVLEEVSCSRLMTFVECHRKYYWQYVRNIETKKLNIPFFVGGLFHEGLEKFYSDVPEEQILKELPASIDRELDGKFIGPEEVKEVETQKATIFGMLRGYFITHQEDKKWKVIQPEAEFSMPIKDLGIDFIGIIDLLFKRKRNGKWNTYVQEHKTARIITSDYLDRLPFDLQVMMYPQLVEHCLGIKVEGVSYNVVTKPRIRQKQNESFFEFVDRIEETYMEKPKEHFYRGFFKYNQKSIQNATQDVQMITEELAMYHGCLGTKILDPNEWYRNSKACFNYNSRCPFYNLCRYGVNPQQLVMFQERKRREKTIVKKISEPQS